LLQRDTADKMLFLADVTAFLSRCS